MTAFPATTDLHTIPIGQFYWYDRDAVNTPYKAGIFGGTQGIAICTAQNASKNWCTIFAIEHAGRGVAIQARSDGVWKDWLRLALCEAPDIHDLPLATGISAWQPCTYFKNQFREVTISGCASGNLTNTTVITTLPEGFRPRYSIETAAAFEASGVRVAGALIIETSGKVSVRVASRMDYVSFSASFVAA